MRFTRRRIIEVKPAFGLPGNPGSAMMVFQLLVRPTLYALTGCAQVPQPKTVWARLTKNIPSVKGREDQVPVRLTSADGAVQSGGWLKGS